MNGEYKDTQFAPQITPAKFDIGNFAVNSTPPSPCYISIYLQYLAKITTVESLLKPNRATTPYTYLIYS